MNYSSYEHRSQKYIDLLAFNANLGAIGTGVIFVALNACIWEVMAVINSQEFFMNLNRAVLSAAIPFGAIFGGMLASYTADKFGRRKTMMIADMITILGCALSISSDLTVMLIGRIICGVVVGMNYMVIPLYLREISPPGMSGATGSYFRIFFTIGLLLTFSLSFGLENPQTSTGDDFLWRIIFTLPMFFALIRVIIFLFSIKMETPKFYMERDEEDNAILALEQIFREDQVEEVYQREKKFETTKLKDIFGSRYRSQALLVILLIFATEFMGASSLNFYTSIIFLNRTSETPDDYAQTRILNVIFAFVRFTAALLGRYMIDKIGRKPFLLYGNLISIVLAFMITFVDAVEFLIGQQSLVMLYIAVQSLTFTLVLPIYASELLPTFGIAIQVVFQMLCILLVTMYFPFVGVEFSFLIFGVVGLVSFYPILKMVKETRGKTLNEIYRSFQADKGSGLLDTEVETDDRIDEIEY